MSNPLPLRWQRGPLVDSKGMPTTEFARWLRELEQKTGPALNVNGQVQNTAKISGRTEQIGTTVGGLAATGDIKATTKVVGRVEGLGTTTANLDATGKLVNTDAIAADGTGSPLTGGKRGAIALDANNRLSGSFRANAVNLAAVPTSSTTLSNDGVSTAIPIGAFTAQYGDGTVSYNSGSVDPGVFGGPFYIYADDPTFAGGAVTYQFSSTIQNQAAGNGRVLVGSITTVNGVAKTGGGFSGGTGGSRGGRGFIQ
jgi:hypothetical protein